MQNLRLDEAQAEIKIAGRNINNLRYADDITLKTESKEELKSLLMKLKEDSEKTDLKLNIQNTKIRGERERWRRNRTGRPLSPIKEVSPEYMRILIFLPAILISAYALSSPAFLMMYSAYKLSRVIIYNLDVLLYRFGKESVIPCPVLTVAS